MNNQAPDLSPEARRLLDACRNADDPTPDDQARVKARWLAGVAAVAGVSSLTEAARAAGGIGWGLKAVGAALVLAAGAVGLYVVAPGDGGAGPAPSAPAWAGRTHERHEKTVATAPGDVPASPTPGASQSATVLGAPATGASEVIALAPVPAPANPPVAAELVPSAPATSPALDTTVDRPTVDVSARAARERAVASRAVPPRAAGTRAVAPRAVPVVAAAPAASAPAAGVVPEAAPAAGATASGQLGEELALLSQVRSSMQSGAPQRALELLGSYEARFGQPILEMEADALRVDALCRAGQRDAARASAEAFQNEWPGSPLGRRVSAACP